MKIPAIILAAAIGASGTLAYTPDAVIRGDLNGDGSLTSEDVSIMSSYVAGRTAFTAEQFAAADIDGNGRLNVYDLIRLRKNVFSHEGTLPSGTWVARTSSLTRYYTFSGGKCTCTNERTGASSELSCSAAGSTLTIDKETSDILWNSGENFVLRHADGSLENFTYYSSSPMDYAKCLTGNWYAKDGTGSIRCFNIRGVSGSVNGKPFVYKMNGSDFTFIFQDGTVSAAKMTRIDSMHFDMKWDSGRTERFTLRNISVKDGITYVNGILIANKSYSLPQSYDPGKILPEALSAFYTMQADAYKAGCNLWITSGYRSYSYQSSLYNQYAARDGYAKADTYSARPGYSEHQTGLAMDINVAGDSFGYSPESKWLAANCWKYGFIIRYPQGKQDITGYKYEPWHVRYLGKDLAKEVYDSGLSLEEFLCIDSKYKN